MRTPSALLLLIASLSGCAPDGSPLTPSTGDVDAGLLTADGMAVLGSAAFAESCATCHVNRDGFDLALFGFADSTIVRRAVFHVDSATARAIVAHIRSLDVAPVDRSTRPFQVPRASSDEDFAHRLFGSDAWPAGLTEARILAIDPSTVAAAIDFPVWSAEGSNRDWMPRHPVPGEVLGESGSPVRQALAAYARESSDARLVRAVALLRQASRRTDTGPCAQENDGSLAKPAVCFETTRWIAALAGQHVLRSGVAVAVVPEGSTQVQDAFWDVGQAARRSLVRNGTPVDDALHNWVDWMYMGWVLAPGNHASGYTASGLARLGLPRHATFLAIRSMVARAERSAFAYKDLSTLARHAPAGWLRNAYASALGVLEEREARGWGPLSEDQIAEARAGIESAAATLARRGGNSRIAAELMARTRALRGAGIP